MPFHQENLKWGLEELSSRDLQQERWLGTVPGVQSSFEEAACMTFDHSNIDEVINDNKFAVYGPEIVQALEDLRSAIANVDYINMTVREIIDSNSMDTIRSLAVNLLKSRLFGTLR